MLTIFILSSQFLSSPQSTEMALNSMSWAGNDKWMDPNVTQWMEWKVDNEIAGHTKNYGNLTFVVVYNSTFLLLYLLPQV